MVTLQKTFAHAPVAFAIPVKETTFAIVFPVIEATMIIPPPAFLRTVNVGQTIDALELPAKIRGTFAWQHTPFSIVFLVSTRARVTKLPSTAVPVCYTIRAPESTAETGAAFYLTGASFSKAFALVRSALAQVTKLSSTAIPIE